MQKLQRNSNNTGSIIMIIVSFLYLFSFNWKAAANGKAAMQKPGSEFTGNDSTKYYKEFDLPYFQGKVELHRDSLTYPYVSINQTNDSIVLVSFLSKNELKKWIIKKAAGFWYTEFDYKDKGNVYYVAMLFPGDGKYISLRHLHKRLDIKDSLISVHTIIYDQPSGVEELQRRSFSYNFRNKGIILLKDILNFNKQKLDSVYVKYEESEFKIIDGKMYWTKYSSFDLATKKFTSKSKKPMLTDPAFKYHSFFYKLVHDDSFTKQNIH